MPRNQRHDGAEKDEETPEQIAARAERERLGLQTTECTAYLQGLYAEFHAHVTRYIGLTGQLQQLQARVELTEKTLVLTRDHLAAMADKIEFAAPHDWAQTLSVARYVGVRLVDACTDVLRRRGRMTVTEIVGALNVGMFRFRTTSPAREIHAALLRQRDIRKTADGWEWIGSNTMTTPSLFRLVKAEPAGEA